MAFSSKAIGDSMRKIDVTPFLLLASGCVVSHLTADLASDLGGSESSGGAGAGGTSPNTGGINPGTGGTLNAAGATTSVAQGNGGAAVVTGGTSSVTPGTGGAPIDNAGGTTTITGPTGGRIPTGGRAPATGGRVAATGGTTYNVIPTGGDNPGLPTGGNGVITPATGGAPPGAGGSTATGSCTTNTGKTVTFNTSGKACGAVTGWAFLAMGTLDTVSVPTCGNPPVAISATASCTTTTNWPTTGICVTGSVPTNPSPYTSWGINIGANATDPSGSGLGQTFSTVAISATGAPSGATFRYVISVGTVDYCAAATLGTAVAFSTFNTKCYDAPADGTAYAGTGSNITGVQLQIVPGTATITISSMCLTGITFGP